MTYMNAFDETKTTRIEPPLPSTADRDTALSSKGHFCGQIVISDGSGRGGVAGIQPRIVQLESHLEYSWCMSKQNHYFALAPIILPLASIELSFYHLKTRI